MSEQIFIGVAWPYANGSLHLGHIAGVYLPADILARYHRLKGNEVLMVSGSDQHGTPITVRAEQEGKTPQEVVNNYHQEFLDSWKKLGISFDLFTTTGTPNHARTVHDVFLSLQRKGYIYKDTMPLPYCSHCQRYLPDRYVEGECPYCGFKGARGDQCDKCGKPLNPTELLEARCKLCKSSPQVRSSEHFFLRLSAFRDRLLEWVKRQNHWKPNVLPFTLRFLEEGLKDRAITRDIEWGVAVPAEGFEKKRIYVWFEAVIGYLSASKEWAKAQSDEEKWRLFWQGETKSYYFIGKDNIPFHTIIWPAMLLGYGGLNLPFDVPANEFLTLEGKQFSTSRNWAIWVPDYLRRYDPDPLRYLLSANMPETSDTDFSWQEFARRNNDELVATYGNLAHRVLTFIHRHFDSVVPIAGESDGVSQLLLQKVEDTFRAVDISLYQCHFRDGIKAAMALAQETNRYLEQKSPWKAIKKDRASCATTLYVATYVLSCLKTIFYPFLPFSSQKLHQLLGFRGKIEEGEWAIQRPQPGQRLAPPEPLYAKIEEQSIEEEIKRMGHSSP